MVELIITVAVLAALVGLAVPYYNDYVAQSRRIVMESNFRALRKAIMDYHADTGNYPLDANALPAALSQGSIKYLMEIPADPDTPAPPTWGYQLVPPVTGQPAWDSKYQYLIKN